MSASSLTLAKQHGGVCQGSLVKAIERGNGSAASSGGYLMSSNSPVKVPEYCVLVGVRLTCYESWLCRNNGEPPTAIYSVVGASATYDNVDASFRVVTNQGTHLWLEAPSTHCRDVWLKALNSGLERYLESTNGSGTDRVMEPIKPKYRTENMRNPPRHCTSCGRLERIIEFHLIQSATPLSQYGMEMRMDLCPDCNSSQGLVEHIQWMQELFIASCQEQKALEKARELILTKMIPGLTPETISMTKPTTQIELNALSHHKVSSVLESADCVACCRASPTLERLSAEFSQGLVGCMEFIELLEYALGIKDDALAKLKQQALRFNGDMGTALKMLAAHALPNSLQEEESDNTVDQNSTELLQCILEFFLDLLDEGELQSIAFFWPQLLNIHLQMLPASDTISLQRIELLEDFLLTVASQYSVQLAVELIWSHTADLEDSKSLPYCAKRRSAVLRFLCELESLLFDFDMGWGGGAVTLGSILAPSSHQIAILKSGMQSIQSHRLERSWRLSRSQRHQKVLRTQEQNEKGEIESIPPGELAQEALRVAKNADYLSTHMAFTKRLGDIANRLFHKPAEKRKMLLEAELIKLNSSGSMGGDPLNRIKANHAHTHVVRIPTKEGHVFRSKERTPVLLLVETIDEAIEEQQEQLCTKNRSAATSVEEEDGDEQADQQHAVGKDDKMQRQSVKSETSLANDTTTSGNLDSGVEKQNKADRSYESVDRTETLSDSIDTKQEEKSNDDARITDPVLTEPMQIEKDDVTSKNVSLSTSVTEERIDVQDDESAKEEKIKEATFSQSAVPGTPNNGRQTASDIDLRGSQDGRYGTSTPLHALRRFDSPKGLPTSVAPTANKESVEALVTNVVAKQLQMPNLLVPPTTEDSTDNSQEIIEEQGLSAVDDKLSNAEQKNSRMSALGSAGSSSLSKTGDTRREVLNALMVKGMTGSHTIASGLAVAMQRQLQDIERRRAVELLLTGSDYKESEPAKDDRQELLKLGIRSISRDELKTADKDDNVEDNEAMEAIRLLLIQYQVSQGVLSMNDAAKALAPQHLQHKTSHQYEGTMMHLGREFPEIDAGDIDSRLAGCGTLPPAVLQALTLKKANVITNGELLELVKKDLEFVRNVNQVEAEAHKDKLHEDSAFWGRFAFGERWAEKRSRIAAKSPDAVNPGWDLNGVIVKANDDLRQEGFIMQLIELCREAFDEAGLELWLLPYRILSTGRTTGIIEMVRNAMSFDALKKRPGYGKGGLREHLHRMTQYEANPSEAFKSAQKNFVRSLAAYSLLSYLFLFKDRHNGNILLDTAGHVIHIDFGFVFGIAPGGSFSLEVSTPFKLTEEMIDVMGGLQSSLFSEFITLFCCGFLALQAHCDTFCTIVEISCRGSTFKCFEGRDSVEVVGKLRERFQADLSKEESIAFCLDLIKDATQSYGTAQYDYFQYLSQGIAA